MTQATAIEVGDTVNVLSSEYEWDHYSGPAEVLEVEGDEILVFMGDGSGNEIWFGLQRIKK